MIFRTLIVSLILALTFPHSLRAEDWSLEIVPTDSREEGQTIDTTSPFYVVLTNTSKHDLIVWKEWCSWGYYCLSFTVTLPDGKEFQIKKYPREWSRNFPDTYIIHPNQHFLWKVNFSSKAKEWDVPSEVLKQEKVTIQAQFEIPGDFYIKNSKAWVGKVSSPPIQVMLYK